jgi:ribosomal protein L21
MTPVLACVQAAPGSKVQLGRVLALKDEGVFHVGKPYLESVRVEAEIIDDVRGPKLTIFKMNSKKHYRRKTGHRQALTKFLITKIANAE